MFSPTLASLAKELNARVCENRRYFRSILIFMLKRFRLHRKMRLSQLRIAIMFQRRSSWHSDAQRQVIPVAHLWFFFSCVCCFLTIVTGNASFRGVGAREIIKAFWKRTSFSLVCMNVLHQMDKEGLVFHECSKIRVNVNTWQSSCLHRCDQVVCLCWCLCQAMWQTILDWNMSKIMNTPGTSFLSKHRNHVNRLLLFK